MLRYKWALLLLLQYKCCTARIAVLPLCLYRRTRIQAYAQELLLQQQLEASSSGSDDDPQAAAGIEPQPATPATAAVLAEVVAANSATARPAKRVAGRKAGRAAVRGLAAPEARNGIVWLRQVCVRVGEGPLPWGGPSAPIPTQPRTTPTPTPTPCPLLWLCVRTVGSTTNPAWWRLPSPPSNTHAHVHVPTPCVKTGGSTMTNPA